MAIRLVVTGAGIVVGDLEPEQAGAAADYGFAIAEQVVSEAKARLHKERLVGEARHRDGGIDAVPLLPGVVARLRGVVICGGIPDSYAILIVRHPVAHVLEPETKCNRQPAAGFPLVVDEERGRLLGIKRRQPGELAPLLL